MKLLAPSEFLQRPFNFDEMRNVLLLTLDEDVEEIQNSTHPFGRRSDNQPNHDMKIGAAGELLVCFKIVFIIALVKRGMLSGKHIDI